MPAGFFALLQRRLYNLFSLLESHDLIGVYFVMRVSAGMYDVCMFDSVISA
jgi:hypothetical protein